MHFTFIFCKICCSEYRFSNRPWKYLFYNSLRLKILWLQVLWKVPCTTHLWYYKILFLLSLAIKVAVFKCILPRKFQELAGVSHDFLVAVLSDLALFFWSNKLWASILLLTSKHVLALMYKWTRSSRILLVISLSV